MRYHYSLVLILTCFSTNLLVAEVTSSSLNSQNWKDLLCSQLEMAEESIDVAVNSFNDKELADCLIEAHRRGVRVRVYLDKAQMIKRVKTRDHSGENGVNIRFSAEPDSIHENFCIIDGKKVIRKLCDWITVLPYPNKEDFVISKERKIVSSYDSKFESLWNLNFSVIYPYRF